MKSCLDGYLTNACHTCPDWADGSDDMGIGCATHYPIMWCPHFAETCEREEAALRLCKNCANYDKSEKMCSAKQCHTAKKNACQFFSW